MVIPCETRPAHAARPTATFAGRYRLGQRLGKGGAAKVYRATDLRCGHRPVAVKIYHPDHDPESHGDCTREARILRRLRHPGLVSLYDAAPGRQDPFLTLQLVDGGTLRHRLQRTALSPTAVIHLGERLAYSLRHVHRAGVAHCDVKPANVLLDRAGCPHLTDFGVARVLDEDTTPGCAADAVPGTAAYLAPEQVRGDPLGPRTDVYALGLVLIECLTGRREYGGGPLEAALSRLHRPPAVPGHLPAGLADLLAAMTASMPWERPSAQQCAQRLTALTRSAAGDRA
jgi:serine/threonine protein kinase